MGSAPLRAVLYARCSTEEESQKNALVQQEKEGRQCIQEQGWILVDTYVESRSGTTSKNRNEYQRLFHDLKSPAFDVIVIKSQDRLMRNTKDWYLFLDNMQRNNKLLYMYLEKKFYTPDDSLITGIKSILAEEYSRELSRKINNAHRNRQREGIHFVITGSTYGFYKMPDKSIAVNEKEAEMIRMACQLSAEGYGTHVSSRILYEMGYRNRKGEKISPAVLRRIIRNPMNIGTVVQNRQHYNFETKRVTHNPESEWIFHENAVPAIVDRDLYEKANAEMDRRREKGGKGGSYVKYSKIGPFNLSGKIVCGLCGKKYYRTFRKRENGQTVFWKCSNYLQNGRSENWRRKKRKENQEKKGLPGCDNAHLDEKKIYELLESLCKRTDGGLWKKEELLNEMLLLFEKVLSDDGMEIQKEELEKRLKKISGQKEFLLQKLLDGVVSDGDYKTKNDAIQKEIAEIQGKLQKMETDYEKREQLEQRLALIKDRLEGGIIEKAQMADMLQSLKEIRVFPGYLELAFDSFALLGLEEMLDPFTMSIREETDRLSVVRVPQICAGTHKAAKEEEKQRIVEYMKENPKITAKQIAAEMGLSTSLVVRRINELRKEEKIRYSSPNGRGYWMVLTEDGTCSEAGA